MKLICVCLKFYFLGLIAKKEYLTNEMKEKNYWSLEFPNSLELTHWTSPIGQCQLWVKRVSLSVCCCLRPKLSLASVSLIWLLVRECPPAPLARPQLLPCVCLSLLSAWARGPTESQITGINKIAWSRQQQQKVPNPLGLAFQICWLCFQKQEKFFI